jgi:hypothetical protein
MVVSRADAPRVIVVDVRPGASGLDADRLRASIATELRAQAADPGDPRAGSATGTITVDADGKSSDLSVTYLARASPIVRHVPLPADSGAARAAVVLLAGNLARDEAGELASELRRRQESGIDGATAQTPPDPKEAARLRDASDVSQVRAMALYFGERQARTQNTIGWTAIVVGAVGIGASSGLSLAYRNGRYTGLAGASAALVLIGVFELTRPAPFDTPHVDELFTLDDWVKAAQKERTKRRTLAILKLVGSAAWFGVAAWSSTSNSSSVRDAFGVPEFVLASAFGLDGIYDLATYGPVETAVRAYEQGSGRALWPKDAAVGRMNVAFVPGGAMCSFAGTF